MDLSFFNDAYAMAQPQGQGQNPSGGMLQMVIFFVLIFGVFYLFIMRPQKKRQMDHQKFLSALQKGEEVFTDSGIIGRIYGIADRIITLEIADNVRVKILKSRIAGLKKSIEESKTAQ